MPKGSQNGGQNLSKIDEKLTPEPSRAHLAPKSEPRYQNDAKRYPKCAQKKGFAPRSPEIYLGEIWAPTEVSRNSSTPEERTNFGQKTTHFEKSPKLRPKKHQEGGARVPSGWVETPFFWAQFEHLPKPYVVWAKLGRPLK